MNAKKARKLRKLAYAITQSHEDASSTTDHVAGKTNYKSLVNANGDIVGNFTSYTWVVNPKCERGIYRNLKKGL